MNWRDQKRANRNAAFQERQEADERERFRVANLSLYERIEECADLDDVKAVLQVFRDRLENGL